MPGPRTRKVPTWNALLFVEETWSCTCAMPSMEPGSVVVERTLVPVPTAGVIATAEELTAPVDCAGVVTPRPITKIVTLEPDTAGLAQLFCVPSALRARGCK